MTKHRASLGAGAVFVVGLALFAFATTPRQEEADARTAPPLEVATAAVSLLPGYAVEREFIGRIEARRESEVGFELGGLVAAVTAEEGEAVAAGEPLARLDTRRLEARRAELEAARDQARAALELAELTRDRVREASELDAVSPQSRDEAEMDVAAKRAALERARAALGTVEVDLEKSSLRAPFDALVAHRLVDEGQVIAAGQPVLHLLERSRPEVRLGVAGGAVGVLEVGSRHELTVGERRVPATVRAVLPVRELGTRSVDVILSLDAELDGLRSGDLARLRLERRIDENGFWLPTSALTESARGLWAAYAVRGEPGELAPLERRELELLHQDGERAFVRGTLADGERVVLDGLHRLVPGLTVRVAGAVEARKGAAR